MKPPSTLPIANGPDDMTKTIAILFARSIFGGAFLLATSMKFAGMDSTAGYIASIGFPSPLFFAWLAAFFEVGLALALFTGRLLTEPAALAVAYTVPGIGPLWTLAPAR